MFSSHNLRMLNPAVSQTPLLQNVSAKVPLSYICSKTVKLRNYVWIDGYDQYIPAYEQEKVVDLNRDFHKHGVLQASDERKSEVVDPLMHCINVKLNDSVRDGYASITPSPCCGLYHEVVEREKEHPLVILSPQQIEFRPDRYLEHGRMIERNNGVLKTFNLPNFDRFAVEPGCLLDEHYVQMEFELNGFNVATGMLGLGLPPITLLGVFFSNFFGKENPNLIDVPFAVGIHKLRPMTQKTNIYRNQNTSQNNMRKANVKGVFIFKAVDKQQAIEIGNRLAIEFSIANTFVANKIISYTNQLPKAYWMKDMSAEIHELLAIEPHKDSLDIAFDFAAENRLFSTVASGFALFEPPKEKQHMENVRHDHAWAETVFSSTELVYGDFNPQYFYNRKYEDLFVHWTQY